MMVHCLLNVNELESVHNPDYNVADTPRLALFTEERETMRKMKRSTAKFLAHPD